MTRKLLPFAVLATLAAGNAHAVVIDDFTTPGSSITSTAGNPFPTTGNIANADNTITHNRQISITGHSGPPGGVSAEVIEQSGGLYGYYAHSNSAGRTGVSTILWDNNGQGLGANLTDADGAGPLPPGSANALNLSILSIDQGNVSLAFDVTDYDGNLATLTLNGLGAGLHSFQFGDFAQNPGNAGPTNFANVYQVLLTVTAGTDSDLTLDLVETNEFIPPPPPVVPEPTSLSLLGIGLAALARRRRKA